MFKSITRTPPRSFLLALCLLILLVLLAASCGSNSDSTAPEDPDPQDPGTTTIAGEDSSVPVRVRRC